MKKILIIAVTLVGLGLLAKRFASQGMNIDWEKKFDAMPDNAPPKWMFRNITAIRDNTDRIIEILDPNAGRPEISEREPPAPGSQAPAARTAS